MRLLDMSPTDALAVSFLVPLYESAGVDEPALVGWWEADRRPAEGLADFLARHGVLTADAPRTLPMAQKGYLRLDAANVVAPDAGDRLRRLVPRAPAAPPPAPAPRLPSGLSQTFILDTAPVVPAVVAPPKSGGRRRLAVGDKVGRCLLTRVIGAGGGGTVFEAVHQGLGIPVAVKVLPEGTSTPAVRAALRSEARLLAQLNHPNVVRVFDLDDEAADPYLVLELVVGSSLADLIAQCGWLRPEQAAGLVAQAAFGLDAAEEIGIVHRDVKPANLLVAKNGLVKLADLGLAACREAGEAAGVGGTVGYMAPERFSAVGQADLRSDVYALGVTLYEALTGRLPYVGTTPFEVMVQHASAPVPDPRAANPTVPDGLAGVAARMMAKDPADRYPDYPSLVADLAGFVPDPAAIQPLSANSTRYPAHLTNPSTGRIPMPGPRSGSYLRA